MISLTRTFRRAIGRGVDTPVAVNVPTDQARRLTFQCGMGMYRSAVLVQ